MLSTRAKQHSAPIMRCGVVGIVAAEIILLEEMKNLLLYYVFMMVVVIPSPHSVVVNAQQIKFTSNENIQEKHKEAHYAPRSQKYWDEHNIERPDYAKTDAEIMAERGERIGSSKLLSIRGHRLGTSIERDRISEKEARLKRFEMNPKDMLDNMKAD
eukprot:scaffold8346_cov121-Skeletonema_dohrnii-CCMP3373.AAC.2